MRVTQYRIANHTWDAYDEIFIMDIICNKLDIETILKRLKKKDKYIPHHLKINAFHNDDNARIQFNGKAYMWQEIEDVFPMLSDSYHGRETTRKILDPSLILERKTKKPTIIGGMQYFYNRYLGMMQVCLN